jgi:DtxR family Mn-dependent transcriptional regulator
MSRDALTPSLEDYLKAVFTLQDGDGVVRVVDVAERLSVSKPSVCRAMDVLREKGLVAHTKFEPVRLTADGAAIADALVRKHRTIKEFLIAVLGLDETLADDEACAMEHAISNTVLKRIAACER